MSEWHNTYTDSLIGGLYVGKLGAMKYILDKPEGNAITGGYHSFYMHEGTLMGKVGSRREIVVHN